MNNTFLLCYAPEPRSQVTESVLIYRNWSTVNSRLADTPLWLHSMLSNANLARRRPRVTFILVNCDKIQIHGKSCSGLTAEMTPAITDSRCYGELRTVSWYQSDNFIVLTLDKAYTLYFLLSYSCQITVCRSSFAKIRFKDFRNVYFSHSTSIP